MAFNEILVGRLNRWAQKLLVIKNTALRNLSPDLQTVLPLFQGVEERYLQGWQRFAASLTSAAVAAQNSGVTLSNPKGSQVVIVVEKLTILVGAVSNCVVYLNGSAVNMGTVPTLNGGLRLDSRGQSNPSGILSFGTATPPSATLATTPQIIQLSGTTPPTPDWILNPNQEWTVLPNDSIVLLCLLVNTQMIGNIIWRERPLESSELT